MQLVSMLVLWGLGQVVQPDIVHQWSPAHVFLLETPHSVAITASISPCVFIASSNLEHCWAYVRTADKGRCEPRQVGFQPAGDRRTGAPSANTQAIA